MADFSRTDAARAALAAQYSPEFQPPMNDPSMMSTGMPAPMTDADRMAEARASVAINTGQDTYSDKPLVSQSTPFTGEGDAASTGFGFTTPSPPGLNSYDTGYTPDLAAMDGGSAGKQLRASANPTDTTGTNGINRAGAVVSNLANGAAVGIHNIGVDTANNKSTAPGSLKEQMAADQVRKAEEVKNGVGPKPGDDSFVGPSSDATAKPGVDDATVDPKTGQPITATQSVAPGTNSSVINQRAAAMAAGQAAVASSNEPWKLMHMDEQTYRDIYKNDPEKMKELVTQAGDIALVDGRVQEMLLKERADELAASNAANDARVLAGRQKAQTMLDGVTKATEEAKLAATSVGSKSYLERNPISGIAGALAAMIGGYSSGRFGGPNTGLEMLNQAIDRDIQMQKYQADKKGKYADDKMNLYNTFRKQLGDDDLAYQATKNAMLEVSSAKLLAQSKTASNNKLAKDTEIAAQLIDQQKHHNDGLLQQQLFATTHPQPIVGSGGLGKPTKGASPDESLDDMEVPLLGGVIRGGKEEAAKVRAHTQQVDAYSRDVNELKAVAAEFNKNEYKNKAGELLMPKGFNTEVNKKIKRIATRMISQATQMSGSGVPGASEAKTYAESIMDQLGPGGNPMAAVADSEKWVQNTWDSMKKAYAPRVVDSNYRIDPKTGRKEIAVQYAGSDVKGRPEMPGSFKASK